MSDAIYVVLDVVQRGIAALALTSVALPFAPSRTSGARLWGAQF